MSSIKCLLTLFGMILVSFPVLSQNQHSLFSDLLAEYVQDGRVNYADLRHDSRLDDYLAQLSNTDIEHLASIEEKHTFWINLYNAFTLKLICQNYPVKSITDLHWGGRYISFLFKKTVWDTAHIVVHGRKVSLNEIEHGIIRPVFKDPRSHFALVCASISCPPLRYEAFEADQLDEQLEDQGRVFLMESDKNHYDPEEKKAYISPIFKWFKSDFGENDAERLLFIARFLPQSLSEAIRSDVDEWQIKHTDYNWDLNE